MRAPYSQTPNRVERGERRGTVTVELALVLPVLFLFLFAAFEFSRLNMLKHLAEIAAYEGARNAVVVGATANDVASKANSILAAGSVSNATVTTTPATITPETTEVRVDISVPVDGNFWLLPTFTSSSVSGTCLLRTER